MFDYLIVFRVGTPSFTSGEGNSIELREFFLFVFCICLSNCSSTICGKAHLFPIKLPSHLFWKSIYHTGEGLYFVPLIYISTFTPIPHILDYCSFMVAWKQEECIFQLVLLFQSCLGYPSSFAFLIHFRISLSISTKKWLYWLLYAQANDNISLNKI